MRRRVSDTDGPPGLRGSINRRCSETSPRRDFTLSRSATALFRTGQMYCELAQETGDVLRKACPCGAVRLPYLEARRRRMLGSRPPLLIDSSLRGVTSLGTHRNLETFWSGR